MKCIPINKGKGAKTAREMFFFTAIHGESKRRFTVPVSPSIKDLQRMVSERFNLSSKSFTIEYQDPFNENEYLELSFEDEFEDCLNTSKTDGYSICIVVKSEQQAVLAGGGEPSGSRAALTGGGQPSGSTNPEE
ncbi:putative PB1 domain-containing protein [Helianthus annuus]|nr:putative PB1 domain-containing protein [Helianthus annuus]